jgi:hypothetical protein
VANFLVGCCANQAIAFASRKSLAHIFRRHQLRIVTVDLQLATDVTPTQAFHTDQARQRCGEFDLAARPILPHRAAPIEAEDAEGILANIDADPGNGGESWFADLALTLPAAATGVMLAILAHSAR